MKVVVAIDQSDCSITALQSTMCMSWGSGDEVRVVTVFDPFDVSDDRELEEVRRQQLIERAIDGIRTRHPEMTVSGDVLLGSPHDRLLDLCDSWHADLLVIGAHAKPASSSLMLGSLSNSLLDHASCSVMLIKDHDISSGAAYRNVLIPVDRTVRSEGLLQCVLESRWPYYVSFHVVTVIPHSSADDECFDQVNKEFVDQRSCQYELLKSEHKELAGSFAEKLNEKFGRDRASFEVLEGNVRDEILRVADALPAGLIVVGSGKDFLQKLLLGSVSQSIASQSACSVEVVKCPESGIEAA